MDASYKIQRGIHVHLIQFSCVQNSGYISYTFVPVIMDEVRVSRTTVITFPDGPYASVKIEGESDLNEFPSKYFYDKNHNRSSGYNHYIAGNISDPITYLVPTVEFSWG